MKHVIIGTAGHIDHGKTALIEALTGRNTDRLAEEKRRGITIDLGFTWFDLKDGTRCGIVDVPGHEKFINNMAAGVAGMDLVLMVVAADEGVMPQTREHLDVLELFGIVKAILVFSKCDLVDASWMEMVEADTREQLRGTILENAPSVRVSSVTGEGIEALKDLIAGMVSNEVEGREINGIPYLPVDRVFTLPGHGTIVTGTLLSGSICRGDTLEIFPVGKRVRVRSVQVHETPKESCEAGQRAALNIPDVGKDEIRRGCVLAPEGSMRNTALLDVRLNVLKDSGRVIRNRERLHLFLGTGRILCRAVLLDHDELKPGENGLAQLFLEKDTAVRRGERFVVRFYSPLETIGGGVILDANPVKKKRFREDVIDELKKKETGSFADIIELKILAEKEGPVCLRDLARSMACSEEDLNPHLQKLVEEGAVLEYPLRKDVWYWHTDQALLAEQGIDRALNRFHSRYPYRYGIPKAEIHTLCMKRAKQNVFDACISRMIEENRFGLKDGLIGPAEGGIRKDDRFLAIEQMLTDNFEEAGYQMLRFSEIDKKWYSDEVVTDVLRVMIDEETAVRVGTEPELFTMKHLMDEAKERVLAHFRENDVLTLIQVKELFGTSRKCARAIVEYLDGIQVTRKAGAETERVENR